MIKIKGLIILILLCSACAENQERDLSPNITDTQIIFTNEINNIFGEVGYKDLTYYQSVGAEYVIFQIKSSNMDLNLFEKVANTKIKGKGWIFLHREKSSIIFCRKKDQLEVSIPRNILGNSELEDGDILRQNENEWNITFYKAKKIKAACND